MAPTTIEGRPLFALVSRGACLITHTILILGFLGVSIHNPVFTAMVVIMAVWIISWIWLLFRHNAGPWLLSTPFEKIVRLLVPALAAIEFLCVEHPRAGWAGLGALLGGLTFLDWLVKVIMVAEWSKSAAHRSSYGD
jgi:hypothetical protein